MTRFSIVAGIERVNSLAWNPHKTMAVPLQCSIFLVNKKGLLHECNSAAATYLFQQDKFYDIAYDLGDKSLSCGRKVDAFKFWLMFKKHGVLGFEKLVDHAFEMTEYFVQQVLGRSDFELIIPKYEYTSVCFVYIPKYMRQREGPRDDQWWNYISKITISIKEQMMKNGNLMIGYTPLHHKNIGNFFRMVITCQPPATRASMDFVLNEIEKIAEKFEFHDQF